MFNCNQAILLGNLTNDPELKYTSNGNPVLKFSMATNRSIKDDSHQSGWKSIATYHNIVFWGKYGETLVKRLKRGDKVFILGRIDNRSYEKDGVRKYYSEIVASQVTPHVQMKDDRGDERTDQYDDTEGEPKDDINIDELLSELDGGVPFGDEGENNG